MQRKNRPPVSFGGIRRPKKWTLLLLVALFCVSLSLADDDYDFVKEVVEEDQENYGDYFTEDPVAGEETYAEEMKRQQEESQLKRKAQEERIAQEKADRIQQEREAAFDADLAKMSAEQQKAARKQKKRDAAIVRRVLKATKKEDHYSVLGLRNWNLQIPERQICRFGLKLRIPGFSLFHISPKAIKKVYRKLAMTVHPDKNRDGRANEAFIAVENSASILTDERQRIEYDEMIRELWKSRRKKATKRVAGTVDGGLRLSGRVVGVFRRVLGPFAFPVAIMGSLLI